MKFISNLLILLCIISKPLFAQSPPGDVVGKVTVGYQGWFGAPGDSLMNSWQHNNIEVWPEVREYTNTYQTSYPNLGNGQPAKLFSSYDQQTVNTHFAWMEANGIDVAAVQRFANEISPGTINKTQRDGLTIRVKNAAEATGRKFYVMYDMSGGTATVMPDWTNTIVGTMNLTSSPAYAYQNGKPVVCLWGIGYTWFNLTPTDAIAMVNWFKAQGCYVIGGVPGQWRSNSGDSRADYAEVYKNLDMVMPWAVGRGNVDQSYIDWITGDMQYCNSLGIDYQPDAFPGFSFHNTNASSPPNQMPRNHGDYMWAQFATMKNAGAKSVYISMFDEVNEGTAIFKCAEDASMIPTGNWFLTLDAEGTHVSSDFYLRLVNDGGKMIKGQIPYTTTRPTPYLPDASFRNNTPYKAIAANLPGKIEAEYYDNGGQGYAYFDIDLLNTLNGFRGSEGVDVEMCGEGTYNIGSVNTGEWVKYTVNVNQPGSYILQARVASAVSGKTFHVELDGTNISGTLTVPNTGGVQTYQTISVVTPSLTIGNKVLRVVMDSDGFKLDYLNFQLNSVPVISSLDTLKGALNVPFSKVITASNDPITFSATGLPAGLTINQYTGLISGKPTVTGTFTVTISASNFTGTSTKNVLIIIKDKLLIGPYGDSITQSNNTHNSYRYNLWTKLLDGSIPFAYVGSQTTNFSGNPVWPKYNGLAFDSINEGHWGITSQGFVDNYPSWIANYTPDLILLHLGTNDIGGGTPLSTSQANLTKIIQLTRAKNPDLVVFIAKLIPRSGVVPTAYNDMVASLAASLTTSRSPIVVVDQATGFDTNTDTFDQTHPNASGEEKMARRWFEAIVTYYGIKLPVPVITSSSSVSGNVGINLNYTINASNTALTFSATGLPRGLSVNPLTGDLLGWPAQSGIFNATISATNTEGTGSAPLTITIAPYGGSAYNGTVRHIPGKIEAEDYDNGGEGVAYHDTEATNYGGAYRTTEGVDVGPCSEGGYNVGFINGGEWLNYKVNVDTAGIYSLELRIATPNQPSSFHVEMDGVNCSGTIQTVNTTDWSIYQTVSVTTPPLTLGAKTLRIVFDNGGFNLNYINFKLKQPAPVITSNANASGVSGNLFSYNVIALNSPGTYTATGLPAGITINKLTGLISGTTFQSGVFNALVTASNAGGTATQAVTLTFVTSTPYGGNVRHIPGKIEVEDFDNGGEGVAYHDDEATNYGGQYRPSEGVDIGIPTEGGYEVGFINGGEWLNYHVNVDTAASYTLGVRVATPNTNLSFHIEMDGVDISGPIKFSNTGSWDTYQTFKVVTPALTVGPKLLKIVFDGGGFNFNYITFKVNQAAPAITSAKTASGTVNGVFNYAITAINSPTGYNVTGLPDGLKYNSYTGIISGTPSTAGTYTAIVSASNAGGTGIQSLTITINNGSSTPYGGTPWPIPGTIEAENYDDGGEGVAYHDNDAVNYGGQQRTNQGVDVETAGDATGVYDVGFTNPGEWMKYTVNVTTAGAYTLQARVASPYTGKSFHVEMDGTTIGTIAVANTGGWQTYQTVTITTPTLTAGSHTLRLVMDTDGFNINYVTFAPVSQSPVISSPTTATGTVGTFFTYTITASNNPTSFAATGLPAGLTVNTSTGVISGTPTTAGTFSVTVSASNAGGTGSQAVTITINPKAPVITSATTATGTVGASFSYSITASDNPTSFAATGLPVGLTVNTSTGVISGTPTTAGTFSVTVSASNAGGTGSQVVTITINPKAPVITSATTSTGTVGASFTYNITASNNPTNFAATGLPAGLSVNTSTGVISGTPTTAGTYSVTVSASNAGGTGSQTVTITINATNTPYGGTAWVIPGTIEVENYDNGGEGVAYHDNEITNYGGSGFRSAEGVDVGICSEGGYEVGYIGAGEWMKYSVNVSTTGIYTLEARIATPNAGRTFHAELDGVNISGAISVPVTGSWDVYQSVRITTSSLTAGCHVLRLYFDTGDFNFNYVNFTLISPPSITSSSSATGTIGTLFNYAITASNSPTSYNATGLPSGLTINTTTGIISGTPTVAGNYTVTISATNAAGTGSKQLSITINNANTPYGGTSWNIPGTIEAENYDNGGEGIAYHDNEATNYGGQLRINEGVDIETTGDATGAYNVGWTNAGEWLLYSVNVTTAGSYTLQARVASPNSGKSFHVEMDGTTIANIAVPTTAGWQTYQTVSVSTPSLTAGKHTMRVYMDTDGFNFNYLTFASAAAPNITSPVSASANIGNAFSYTITASNSPTSYSATGLPAGLTLNTTTGAISGTPTKAGTSNVTISATNASGTGSTTLTITVNPVTDPTGVVTCYRTPGTITVDGSLNETGWNMSKSINLPVVGTLNNTGTFGVMWDSNNLYIGVKVLDANLYSDSPNLWDDDAVEVYIDANYNKLSSYDGYDNQIITGYNKTDVYTKFNLTGLQHAYATISGGYTIELAVPWSQLGITNPSNGLNIGFDVSYDDDDNGGTRESQAVWNGTIDDWQNTSSFGTLTLNMGTAPKLTTVITSTISDKTITIYPNPVLSGSIVTAALPLEWDGATQVSIWNDLGEIVYDETQTVNNNQLQIILDKFKGGMYCIRFVNGESRITKTVVVE